MRFVVFLLALAGLFFVVAFFTPSTPYSTDQWIMGLGTVLAFAAAGASVWLTRNLFASVAILPAVATAVLLGNFLPYQIGLWDLSPQDYSADGQSGAVRFVFLLAWSLLGAVLLGLVVGLLTEVAHTVISARLWPEARDDSHHGLHPG